MSSSVSLSPLRGERGPRVLALALLFLSACATTAGASSSSSSSPQVGAPAPAITVQSLSGKPIVVGAYRGKVVLLDVWASWCEPCKQELPILDELAGRLHRKGIEVLAVSVDQKRDNVVKFLRGRQRWSLTIAHDPAGQIADRLQPEKMPTSYIIDRAGIIRYVNSGFVPSDADAIERRLLEVAGP